MINLILKGKLRSTNNIYKSVCFGRIPRVYMSAEGKALKEDYQWQVKQQYRDKPITAPVTLEIALYFNDKRKHDIDNYNKILLDSMTGILFEDDSQIQELKITKHYDKINPRAEIWSKTINYLGKAY